MSTIPSNPDAESWLSTYLLGAEVAYDRGYSDGHRDGTQQAQADDAEFARMVEEEYRRRERTRDLIRWLIESGEAQAKREEFGQRVRAERLEEGRAA
jgi:hypothetical protein